MVDRTEFERWQSAADEASQAADTEASAGHHNWACFLAEQSGQLALKGLLHGVGAGAWGHDLVDLGRVLSKTIEEELPESLAIALQRLSRHYIPTRYPDAHPAGPPGEHYGSTDVEQALMDLETLRDFVARTWERMSQETPKSEAESDAD